MRSIYLWIACLSYVQSMDESEAIRRYMGCYEKFNNNDVFTMDNLTLSTCIDLCPDYTFVALKNSSNCYCGDRFTESDNEINCDFMSTKETEVNWRNSFSVFATCRVGYYGMECANVCNCAASVPCTRIGGHCLFDCRKSVSHQARCNLATKLNDVDVVSNLDFKMDNKYDIYKLKQEGCIHLEKDRFFFDFLRQVTIKRGSAVFLNTYGGKILIHIHSSMENMEEVTRIESSIDGNYTTYKFYNNHNHVGKYLAFTLPDRTVYTEQICKMEVYLQDCKTYNSCEYNEVCMKLFYGMSSFKRCVCKKGFSRSSLDMLCEEKLEDIDECQLGSDRCNKATAFCKDLDIGYSCICKDGFHKRNYSDKFTCTDINECITAKKDLRHRCDKVTTSCRNTVGSYKCICKEGFMSNDNDTYSCLDVDECITDDDGNSSRCDAQSTNCQNSVGSFKCFCKVGFEPVGESSTECGDINECRLNLNQCDPLTTKCSNTFGSYKCICRVGFIPFNQSTCQDIDECDNMTYDGNTAECRNLLGGFQLQCKEGFYNQTSGDSYTCRPKTAAIGFYIVIGIFLLLFVILVILIWKQVKSRNTQKSTLSKVVSDKSTSGKHSEVTEMKNGTLKSISVPDDVPTTKIPFEELEQHIEEAYEIEADGFKTEFEAIPKIFDKTATYSRRETLKLKNRYRNIFPYDDNRVRLSMHAEDPTSDYINASFLKLPYIENNPIILTQGPLKETVDDFWRMIAEQNVEVIVMLTQLEEDDMIKCHQYWPDEESRIYGELVVTKLSETFWLNYCRRTFALSGNLQNRSLALGEITQWQYLKWPDHGTPHDEVAILEFRNKIKKSSSTTGGVLMHCSAGVGRTGCYVAIDTLLEECWKTGFVDVVSCVHNLRQQRPFLVHTLEQYQFIYKVLRASKTWIDTCIDLRNFHDEFLKRTDTTDPQCHSILLEEFLKLRRQLPAPDEDISLAETLLRPHRRVFKAIKVHGYSNESQFIVGSYPEEWDIENFWELVDKDKCLLLLIDHNGDSHPPFLPSSSKPLHLSNLYVELESIESHTFGPVIRVNLTNSGAVAEHVYVNTESMTVPKGPKRRYTVMHASSPTSLFLTWNFFCEIKRFVEMLLAEDQTPVVFVAGKSKCPLPAFYVACSILFEQMTEHNEVDVFKIILQLARSGIGLEFTTHQYQEIYKLIEAEVCQRMGVQRISTLDQRFSTVSRC